MNEFDNLEQKAFEEKKKRKPKMKVSGKSVFFITTKGYRIKEEAQIDKKTIS